MWRIVFYDDIYYNIINLLYMRIILFTQSVFSSLNLNLNNLTNNILEKYLRTWNFVSYLWKYQNTIVPQNHLLLLPVVKTNQLFSLNIYKFTIQYVINYTTIIMYLKRCLKRFHYLYNYLIIRTTLQHSNRVIRFSIHSRRSPMKNV